MSLFRKPLSSMPAKAHRRARRLPTNLNFRVRSGLVAAGTVALAGVSAAGSTWTGADGNWNSNGNPGWNGTGVPNATGAIASFSGAGTTTQNVSGGITVGTITFGPTAGATRTITNSNGITLNQDGSDPGFATISNTGTSIGTTALIIDTGTITLADDLLVGNTGSSSAGSGAIQIKSVIGGTGNVTLSSVSNTVSSSSSFAGAIRLEGTNTFTGSVTIAAGAVTTNNASVFGSSSNEVTLGSLNGGSATFLTTASSLSIGNNFTVAAGSGGTLTLGTASSSGSGTGSYTGTITLDGDLTIRSEIGSSSASGLTFSNTISGSGSLTKSGAGTITLSSTSNSFNGLDITSGRVAVAATESLSGVTTLRGGTATLRFTNSSPITTTAAGRTFVIGTGGGFIDLNGSSVNLSGQISGSGELTKTGSPTLQISADNPNFSGTTTISTGIVQVGYNNGTTGTLGSGNVGNSGTLQFARGNTLAFANNISGSGGVSQAGSGTTVLSGTNSYAGGTTVTAGTLEFQKTASLPTSGNIAVSSGATVAVGVGGTSEFSSLNLSSFRTRVIFADATAALGIDTANATSGFVYGTAMSGTFGLRKLGENTLTLTGANSYAGATTIQAGTLQIGDGGTTGSLGAGSVTNNASLVFNRSDAVAITNTISGSGSVTYAGSGTVTIGGSHSYAGGTNVNAGTIRANNGTNGSATGSGAVTVASGATLGGNGTISGAVNVQSGATLSPGSGATTIGTLRTGDQAYAAGGNYLVKLADASGSAGGGWDTMTMGSLDLSALGSAGGQRFNLKLVSYHGSTLGTAGVFNPTLNYDNVIKVASVSGLTLPGGVSTSNVRDLFTLDTSNFTFNDPTNIGRGTFQLDFVPSGSGGDFYVDYQAAPEPTTAMLFGGGSLALLAKRRRSNRDDEQSGWRAMLRAVCG